MPSDVDVIKTECILAWINSILHREATTSYDLCDGIILLDLLCLTKDFVFDISKLERPIDRFCKIEEILDEFFHTSSVRFVNYEEILQPSDETSNYNVIACALLILTVGLQSKNSVLFMKSAQKLRDDLHQEVVTLTEELVKVDVINPLSSDMLAVLKQGSGNTSLPERDCSTPILSSHPPFGFIDSPLGPLQSLLQSPQIIQKTKLREKEIEIRRLRSALEKERKARMEVESELNECQRRAHNQEQRLEEASARLRCTERQGRELKEEFENAIGYRQRAESAEQEVAKLRGRLERMQSTSVRNRGLEEELKELHAERVSLRRKLESFAAVESRAHQLTLENVDLRDSLSKASSEITLLKQARDLAVEEAGRASEVSSELRRQLSEAKFTAHFNVYHPIGDSTASTPNTDLPPMGESMSLLNERRVMELERHLDDLQATTVPRANYEQLMGEYDHLQTQRQAISDELAACRSENECLKRRLQRTSPDGKLTVDSSSSSGSIVKEKESESEKWAKVIVEAVDEVMEEVGTTDTPVSELENGEVDIETAKSSGGETSDTGGEGEVPLRTDAHLQELRDNRRSLAHEIVELNSHFEELQQQNETLIDETDRLRGIMSDDLFAVREELDAVREQHSALLQEFEEYQVKMGAEWRRVTGQLQRCGTETPQMNGVNGHDDLSSSKLELVTAEKSALLHMINNLKEQVKCLLAEGGEVDDEANFDPPLTEEDILERLGAIIDEFCASMCSVAGRMREVDELQHTLNRSLETNAQLGAALADQESCVAELKSAKDCLVTEVEKMKRFIGGIEASLENSELEFKQAFDSLTRTADHLARVASEREESIVELQKHNADLTDQKVELMSRVAVLESDMKKHECADTTLYISSFEESVRNSISAKLEKIESKLEILVSDKTVSEQNQSLSENVIEMSLENENMAATIRHLEDVVQQFSDKVETLNELVQEKEHELEEAVTRSRQAIEESEKSAKLREDEISMIRNETVLDNSRLRDELKRLLKRNAEMEKNLSTKSALGETLAAQLKKSESRLREFEDVEAQLLDARSRLSVVEKTNARLKDDNIAVERECSLLRDAKNSRERETQALREANGSIERQRVLEAEQMKDRLNELVRVKDGEIAHLKSEQQSKERQIADLMEGKVELRRQVELKEGENAALIETHERSQRRFEELSLERKELIDSRDKGHRRSAALQLEIEELNRTIEMQTTELHVVRNNLQTSMESEENIRTRLHALEREERNLSVRLSNDEEYRNELSNYKRRISTLEERVRFLEEEIGRLEKQAMEWRGRANAAEERNKILDMNIKRYAEGYESKKVALKEAYDKLDEETRMKEHYKDKASSFEEEILPFRRRHSELTAENRRLGHRIRSLEVQLEYANRIIKNGNGKGSMGRSSFPAHDLDASCNGRVPPFPTEEPSDAWQPSTIGALPMNPTEAHRISELQRRNCVQPDHMKTSYPVETQVCDPKEVAEILGSSSTTTVVRHSLPAPNSSAFTTSESFAATMRPEVLSPPRLSATNSNRNRPSSTPLVLQDLNVNGSRLSPVPQREHKFCTAFEIQNTPKQATDLRSSSRSRRGARPKSFQAS